MWAWIKLYINTYFEKDFKEKKYGDYIQINENGKYITDNKKVMSIMLQLINERSLLFSSDVSPLFKNEKDENYYFIVNGFLYKKDKNNVISKVKKDNKSVEAKYKYIEKYEGLKNKKGEVIKELVITTKKNEKYTIDKNLININKTQKTVKQTKPFKLLKNKTDIKISKAGDCDVLIFDEYYQRFNMINTTISTNNEIENDSILRHYINQLFILKQPMIIENEISTIEEYMDKHLDITNEKIIDIIKSNYNVILNSNNISNKLKNLWILQKDNIPLENYNYINITDKEGNKIDNILNINEEDIYINEIKFKDFNVKFNENSMVELIQANNKNIKYTFQFKSFNSIFKNTLFLISSSYYNNKNSDLIYSFDGLIEFYKNIDKDIIGKNGDTTIYSKDIIKVITFLKDFLNNDLNLSNIIKKENNNEELTKSEKEIIENLKDIHFSKLLSALITDISNGDIKILDFNNKKIEKLIDIVNNLKINKNKINPQLALLQYNINNFTINTITENNYIEVINNIKKTKISQTNIDIKNILEKIDKYNKKITNPIYDEEDIELFKEKILDLTKEVFNILPNDNKKEIIKQIKVKNVITENIKNKIIKNEEYIKIINFLKKEKDISNLYFDKIVGNIEKIIKLYNTNKEFYNLINNNKYYNEKLIYKIKENKLNNKEKKIKKTLNINNKITVNNNFNDIKEYLYHLINQYVNIFSWKNSI